jgi:hypothetical protein
MSRGHSNKLAGQIGEHLVCAQLGKLGLIATPFSGNVPTFDILATDEMCRTVPIQVKCSRSDSWPSDARTWMNIEFDATTQIQRFLGPASIANPDLIYVCVAIAAPGQLDRFFILTKSELQMVCIKAYSEWMECIGWKRPRSPESYDCRWGIARMEKFENNWDLIVNRLRAGKPDTLLIPGSGEA